MTDNFFNNLSLLIFLILLFILIILLLKDKILNFGIYIADGIVYLLSKIYNKPNIDEIVIYFLLIGAYEDDGIDSRQKKIINKTIKEFVSITSNISLDEIKYENKLYWIWKKIDDDYKKFDNDNCFYKKYKNYILNQTQLFSEISNEGFNKDFFLRLIKIISINKKSKCKLKYLYLIGKILDFSKEEIENMIKMYSPNFFKEENNKDIKDKTTIEDPYSILNVSENDDIEFIKKRYRELIKKFHPDYIMSKGLDEEFIFYANERLKKINWAFEEIIKRKKI